MDLGLKERYASTPPFTKQHKGKKISATPFTKHVRKGPYTMFACVCVCFVLIQFTNGQNRQVVFIFFFCSFPTIYQRPEPTGDLSN